LINELKKEKVMPRETIEVQTDEGTIRTSTGK
jgi:hypothetical protein